MKLTHLQLAVLVANSAAAALMLVPGQQQLADYFRALARGLQSGANIDAHMLEVAAKLAAGALAPADWQDVSDRINSDSDRLQSS